MSHKSCSDDSCSTKKHGSSQGGCGCGGDCGCGSSCGCSSDCKCGCQDSCGAGKCYSDELLCLADEAWEELLKEKIKAEILKSCGTQLDELAKVVSEANHEKWKELMAQKANHEDYKDRVSSIFEHRQ